MKKKILFMLINVNVGGTEKALLNMLSAIPQDLYEITILMLEEYGGFLGYLPKEVHIEYLKGYKRIKYIVNNPPRKVLGYLLKQGEIFSAFCLALLFLISKLRNDRSILYKYVLRDSPGLKEEFDAAIAYAGVTELIAYYVLNKIKAKKKIQWIHFDVTKMRFSKNFACKTFNKFDRIFVVSDEGEKIFTNMLPHLKEKVDRFYNIILPELVTRMADEGVGFEDDFTGVRILTIGRLSKEKGQDLAIPVLAKLKSEGYKVRWYCIGDGSQRREYEQLIKRCDVENDFLLLGTNPNPYPFLKQADIYVQPSRYEGKSIAIDEAKILHKPIVVTNFSTAKDQINNNENGLIVNIDLESIFRGIKKLIDDEELRKSFQKNLQKENFDTTTELDKFYKVIDK